MAIKVERGEARELVPAKNYLAVVIGITDLGTQLGGMYGPDRQVVFTYELHSRRGPVKNGKGEVLTISAFYSVKLGVKKPSPLCKALEALTGKAITDKTFAIDEGLVEKACRLTVVHVDKNGTKRDQVDAITPLDDDDEAPKAESNTWYYEVDPSRDVPSDVPEWCAKMVRKSKEFGGKEPAAVGAGANGTGDDDVPY